MVETIAIQPVTVLVWLSIEADTAIIGACVWVWSYGLVASISAGCLLVLCPTCGVDDDTIQLPSL